MAYSFTTNGSNPKASFSEQLGIKSTPKPVAVKPTTALQSIQPIQSKVPIQSTQQTYSGIINKNIPTTPKSIPTTPKNSGIINKPNTFNYNADSGQAPPKTPVPTPIKSQVSSGVSSTNQNLSGTGGVATAQGEPKYTPETPNVYGKMTTDLASRASQPIANYNEIQAKLAENAAKQAALEREITAREANIGSSGVDLSLATGERGILSSKSQAGLASLRSEANALSGMLTAANTQQGLQQSALGTATGYAQPTTGLTPGKQVYNPVTSQFDVGGSPFTSGQVSGEEALGAQYAQNASAYKQATGVKNNIVNFLNTTPINPSDFTDINKVVDLVSGRTSDPKYRQLSAQINEYLQTIAPIMGVGGGVTDYKTSLAQGMLDGNMSPQAIVDQLNTIERTAETKLKLQATGSGTYNQGASQSTKGSTGGTLPSGAGWKVVNGVYVKA